MNSKIVLGALALSLCATAGSPVSAQATLEALVAAAKKEGQVMIYHTSAVATIGPSFKAFQEKYGIRVDNFHATGSPLTVRFSNEGASGKMVADVFYASDTTVFVNYADLFQKIDASNFPGFDKLPEQSKLDNQLALSQAQFSFAFMYNTDKVKGADIPRTWNDLVSPKWKGQTLLVDPRSSATYRAAFNLVRKHVPGILTKIAANDPRLVESATPAAQQLAAGAGSLAYINYASHAVPMMEKGAPIKWATIEGPEITRSAWMGATKGPHPNAARLLLHFMLSDEGLAIYCKRADGAKAITDPTGQRTGCNPLDKDAIFLPDEPLAKEDGDAVVKELKLQ